MLSCYDTITDDQIFSCPLADEIGKLFFEKNAIHDCVDLSGSELKYLEKRGFRFQITTKRVWCVERYSAESATLRKVVKD
jgi:hypothetical protein